jgi:hypothetical protein
VKTRDGDVVVLVMRGVSVCYLGAVMEDGEGLDAIKERFTATTALRAFSDAQAMTRLTGGRVLKWMSGASEPDLWPVKDAPKPN